MADRIARKMLISFYDEACEAGRKMSGGHLFCADRSGAETSPNISKKMSSVFCCAAQLCWGLLHMLGEDRE